MSKRILLFFATNLAVVITIGLVVRVTGLDRMVHSRAGISYTALLAFSALWGFAGAFISLALSKPMAKLSTGAQVIVQPRSELERWLVATVHTQAKAAGVAPPEVAIFESPTPNAFATGARRNAALVAVSTGLLRHLQRDEVEAVLGHEVSHIANGDMVTMTLLQGVVNSFVVFFSKLIGLALASRDEEGRRSYGGAALIGEILAQIVLTLLGSIICAWFSRQREFRADRGGAALASRNAMIQALARLEARPGAPLPGSLKAFAIAGPIGELFSTHPSIAKRIAALQARGA